jgi:drug/metabolite transporter (DMT)-like permease
VLAGLVLLLAPLSVTVSTTWVKKHAAGSNSLLLNRDAMALAAVVLLAMGVTVERDSPMALTGVAVGSIVYLALMGTVFTFGVYMWLLRFVPASRLSLTAYVTPVVALLLGALWGGEAIGAGTLAGTLLVLAGVALATVSARVGGADPRLGAGSTDRVV